MADSPKDDKAFQDLDRDKFKAEVKAEAVTEAKQALVDRLSDKKKFSWEEEGRKEPGDYKELFGEVDKRTVKPEQVEKMVDDKMADRDKQRQEEATKKTETDRKRQMDDQKAWFETSDKQWYDLQQKDKIPKVEEKLQEKIQKGEKLSKEEIEGDEGLQVRAKLFASSRQLGKSVKEVFYEDYEQQPAGAKAPVMGARPSTPHKENKELTYAETSANRKRIYGH